MNWKRSTIGLGIAVGVFSLLAYGLTKDPNEIISGLPGHMAPDFTLPTLDGTSSFSLEAQRGKVTVVNYWASWCTQCDLEHQYLSSAARLYADLDVRFVGILFDDEPEYGIRWIAERGGQAYPAVWDQYLRTSIAFGLRGVPETFVIDQSGIVVRHFIGPIWGYVIQDFEMVLDSLTGSSRSMAPGRAGPGQPLP